MRLFDGEWTENCVCSTEKVTFRRMKTKVSFRHHSPPPPQGGWRGAANARLLQPPAKGAKYAIEVVLSSYCMIDHLHRSNVMGHL